FSSVIPPPPRPTLFPYTTLFRSGHGSHGVGLVRGEQLPHACGACRLDLGVVARKLGFLHGAQQRIVGGVGVSHDRDGLALELLGDRKSTRLNSSHVKISYAVFCL